MPLNPARFTKVFGSTFVRDYAEHPLLTIGSDVWTRGDLARLGIVQTRACSILSTIAKQLKVRNLKAMYAETSPYSFAEYPAGVTTLFVLFAIFLDRDLDPEQWYKAGKQAAIVSFVSLKHRELEARAREKRETKGRARKAARSRHEGEVARFISGAARS